jgi:hypothetical protein
LFRFDGILFDQYHLPQENIAMAEVKSLPATADGGLWVGSRTGVAFLKDGKAKDFYRERRASV